MPRTRNFRGAGLATEAARHSIDWLFENTGYGGVSAIISTYLNPGSVNVVKKLGFCYRDRMSFDEFLPDTQLAQDVLGYEVWRLGYSPAADLAILLHQSAYRAGQLLAVSERAAIQGRIRFTGGAGDTTKIRSGHTG